MSYVRVSFAQYSCTLAARHCQMIFFKKPIFGWAVALFFACNTPQVPEFSEFRGGENLGKTAICQQQWFFCRRNGSEHKCTVLLENLISIRISSRAPGQNIAGEAPPGRLQRWPIHLQPMMATTFFGGYGLFLRFCTSFQTVLKSFILFGNFFTSKTSFSDAPSSLTNIKNG